MVSLSEDLSGLFFEEHPFFFAGLSNGVSEFVDPFKN